MPVAIRNQFHGLNTDNTPDALGDSAFREENVVPASATTVKAREGVSLVKHDQPGDYGRSVIVDGAPGAEGSGLLITVIDGEPSEDAANLANGELDELQIGNYFYRPPQIADTYGSCSGIPASNEIVLIAF